MRVIIMFRYGKGTPVFLYQNTGLPKQHIYTVCEQLFDAQRLVGDILYEQPLGAYVKLVTRGYVRLSQFVFIMLKPV